MSVTSNSGTIVAAGQGTMNDISIGTNDGSVLAPEDSNTGSGSLSNVVIGDNGGTVSTGSISGMSVTSNSATIVAAAHSLLNALPICTNDGSVLAPEDSNTGSGS